MPVAELLARCSAEELGEWMAYEKVTGPLGAERADMLHGILTAVLANTARGKKGRRARPADFIPKWDTVKRRMGWEQMLTAVRSINSSLGGRDLTRDR